MRRSQQGIRHVTHVVHRRRHPLPCARQGVAPFPVVITRSQMTCAALLRSLQRWRSTQVSIGKLAAWYHVTFPGGSARLSYTTAVSRHASTGRQEATRPVE